MIRKLLLLATALTMIFAISGLGAGAVDAQTTTTCRLGGAEYYNIIVTCPGAVASDSAGAGGSAGSAAASTGTAGSTSTTTGAAVATTELAVTGVESGTLGYVGAGLVGLGSLAAATARRRSRNL